MALAWHPEWFVSYADESNLWPDPLWLERDWPDNGKIGRGALNWFRYICSHGLVTR